MIPKIIHYCWFGKKELPEMAQRCIKSWKEFCPDYEIKEWNESNFNIDYCEYTREAYNQEKWAFVSDVARLYALVNYGGIYMDTDVQVLKSLDPLLSFEAVSGFESEKAIPTGLMGSEKNQRMFVEFLNDYKDKHFVRNDGSMDLTTNVTRITNICMKYGFLPNNQLQTINGFTLLPKDYLCPKSYETKKINLTSNTYVIHHFDGSWHSEEDKYFNRINNKIKWLPNGVYLSRFIAGVKYRGIKGAFKQTLDWFKRKYNRNIN